MSSGIENYNLRVYGLLVKDDAVLVTDEFRAGMIMTKFPGGGLEKGEGLSDCLIREFDEEIGMKVAVEHFFYVNDFLQVSQFNPKDQLLSFYYFVSSDELTKVPKSIPKAELKLGEQSFRWVKITDLNANEFTFPIDRIVIRKLCSI
jgi:ADP-ribose pyrophosphatase YjhB (NUDIX family)